MTHELIEAGVWRHYKGGVYRIMGRARWHESPGSPVIFYMDIGTGRQYARLETDFREVVAHKDGQPVYRFTRIDNEERDTRQTVLPLDSGRCRAKLVFTGHPWLSPRWKCSVCDAEFPNTAPTCPYGRTWPPAAPHHPV
jgi:hypothetical protein